MGIERWYVMFYSDVTAPQSISAPPPESYNLLFQYEAAKFEIPKSALPIGTGQLIPRGKTPTDHRYTAVVMPLISGAQSLRVHVGGNGSHVTGKSTSAYATW